MLGTNGGFNGSGAAAPSSANIQTPTTSDQANQAYNANQNALQQQQQFLQAVQAQNGLGNQSAVYNQLQGIANGTGPNPAAAQLAQATSANTANQAALMAGQRGSSQNVGLMARQAAQQGAANQQNAAGQAATMQANQSLNALSQMGGLATSQANQLAQATSANTSANQSEQQNLLNSIAAQNNANVGMQSNVNSANAGLAQGEMGQQSNLLGNITGAVGSVFGLGKAHGGVVHHLNQGGTYGQIDPNNNPFSQPPVSSTPTIAAPTIASTTASAPGPQSGPQSNVGKYHAAVNSGQTPATPAGNYWASGQAGQDFGKAIAKMFRANGPDNGPAGSATNQSDEQTQQSYLDADVALQPGPGQAVQEQDFAGADDFGMPRVAKGGKVPALVSPGEKYLSPKAVQEVKKGKNPMEVGETIPGKPKVKGAKDSYANDTVPKTLDEGGIVLPRSVTQSKNPHWEAMKFVKATMAKNGGKL
ncbi:unnamed protein product [Sphagnum balticum]